MRLLKGIIVRVTVKYTNGVGGGGGGFNENFPLTKSNFKCSLRKTEKEKTKTLNIKLGSK